MRRLAQAPGLALVLVLACSDDTTAVETGSESEAGSSSSESGTGESTGEPSETDSGSETGTETETGEPEPYCGDGNVDPEEECDDGNAVDDDGCTNACVSACGVEYFVDVAVPEGWFEIRVMRPRSGGGLTLAGDVAVEGETGHPRVATVVGSEVTDAIDGAPLGPSGSPDLPQVHRFTALAMSVSGDLVALGESQIVEQVDQPPTSSWWLARFDGTDLSEVWRVPIPVDDPELRPLDVAALAAGDPVITMTSRVADNDTDIVVARRSFVDGGEVWSSSFTGEFNGGWSLDSGGRVAVGGGDRLWAAGIVRVDWQTWETTIIELDPQDGAVLWSGVPLPDPGNGHEQRIWSLAAGPDGKVAVGIFVLGPASGFNYGAAFLYAEHELAWSLRSEDLPWADGDPYIQPRVAVESTGDVLVSGTYTFDFGPATAARAWIVEMSPDGTQYCNARIAYNQTAGVVPALGYYDGGRAAINLDTYGPGGMGPGSAGNWIAGLRSF